MNLEQVVVLLKQATEAVQTLENASKDNSGGLEADAQTIALAKKYPMKGHVLSSKSDTVRKHYIGSLLALANSSAKKECSQKQRLHLCRIVASYDESVNFRDYVAQSLKITMNHLTGLADVLDSETTFCFAVDLLLLNLLEIDGAGKKEYEAIADVLQFLKLDKGSVEKAARIAKALAEQKFDQLLNPIEETDNINYSNFLGYYPENKYTSILNNLTNIQNMQGNILVVNVQVSNYEEFFELSEYVAEKITFYNCSFRNIRGFRGNKQAVIFEHCRFEDCYLQEIKHESFFGSSYEYEKGYVFIQGNKIVFKNTVFENISTSKHILDVVYGEIEECRFINCKGIELPCSFMFQINGGKISKSLFQNCVMETDKERRQSTTGGVLAITNGILDESNFENCTSKGETGYGSYAEFKMELVKAQNSKIERCQFNKCYCSSGNESNKNVRSYILGMINSSESNNEFTECWSRHFEYGERRGSHNIGQIG